MNTVDDWFHVKHDRAALSCVLRFPIFRRPCLRDDVHTCDLLGSIVYRALRSKHINEGGGALLSKHAAPQAKDL